MVFSSFWIFCASLPNQVEHTWFNSQLHICKYEWARIIFLNGGFDSKLQHCGPCKISWKKSKSSHLDRSGHIEGDIMQNHEQKKNWKKLKNQDFMGKTNFSLCTLPFSRWVVLATWLHVGAPQKNAEKMSLIPIFNKNLPRAHMESEFGVHRKLVKYVVHLSKRKIWKKIIFLHTSYPNSNRLVFGLKEF
jgi:hypothetical protein